MATPYGCGLIGLELECQLIRSATVVLADVLPAAEAETWVGVNVHGFVARCRRAARMASTHVDMAS